MEAVEILFTASLWAAAIRIASPLIFATLGELICERAGVLNLGIEGIMTVGAFAGWVAVYHGADLWTGLAIAALAGAAFGLLHGFMTVPLGLSQHVTGIGITLLATSIASFGYRVVLPDTTTPPRIDPFQPLGFLSDLPVLGPILAEQTARLRGKNPRMTFEQVSEASSTLADKLWPGNWRSRAELLRRAAYHHRRLLRRPPETPCFPLAPSRGVFCAGLLVAALAACGTEEDAARLARVITGRSIGLVLSGGGARAYAHLGVIRALREAGLPFDVIGGCSMGAVVAACVAMGWDDDEVELRIRKAFVESNPLGDYVLPVVSLVRGRRVEDRLQEHFGDTLIEDLGVPFFAVSSDLVSGKLRVHRGGLLRKALRASISLPGILPPVLDEDGSLLVDGAVIRNFPVDVLKQVHRGPIIGVDVAERDGIDAEDFRNPPSFFGWVAAHGIQSPPPIASLLMRAATFNTDPWEGRSGADLLIAPDMPHADMRDWKCFDDVVAMGYEAAVAALQRPHGLFQEPASAASANTLLETAE